MKYLILILAFSASVNVLWTETPQAQLTNNVLIEYCTGTWCQWCPCGHQIINDILTTYPNTVVLAYHGAGSDPWQSYSNGIRGLFGFSAYPTGCIGRRTGIISRSAWSNQVTIQSLTIQPGVIIEISNKNYDPGTRTYSATISMTANTNLSGSFYVNYVLTENNLFYSQTGNSSCIGDPNYEHDNVVKSMINGDSGELLISGDWVTGSTITRSINYVLPDAPQVMDVYNTFFNVFVYLQSGSISTSNYVQQAVKTAVTENIGPTLTANFYSDRRVITQGESVNFFDSTLGSPNSWNWTFAGGTPTNSIIQNPQNIRFNVSGMHSVSLTATSSNMSNSITKTNYITVLPGCLTSWKQTIRVNDAGNLNDSMKFGMSPSGTNGIDTCLGEVPVPPPPPLGVFDCRFILASNEAVKNDFRKDTVGSTIWRMAFQPSISGYPITLNWNIASFPATGGFFLKDEITGTLVNVNMRNQSSYTLTNSGITSLKIEYNNVTLASSVNSGWNIVSVPVRTSDMLYSTLFPGVASQAYTYSNGYVSIAMLSNGTGYWMKFNSNSNFNFTGYPWSPENMIVSPGWNLIGPFDNNIPISSISTNPAGIITSNYFGYNGGYYNPDTLKVGKGYWIRTSAAGYLYQGSLDNNTNAAAKNPLEDFVEVRFANGKENTTSLYLGNPSQITSDYSMPPVPPSGIFDVRFATDKFVEELGKIHSLMLNSTSAETRITLHNARGLKLKIRDGIDGSILNKELTEGTEIVIPANLNALALESLGMLPLTYELSQNYPNPFNPSTVIKYQIPNDGIVKLAVYDVLGREVNLLVNNFQPAGAYEVKFNASALASGVYFYRLVAGDFDEIRKMMVVK